MRAEQEFQMFGSYFTGTVEEAKRMAKREHRRMYIGVYDGLMSVSSNPRDVGRRIGYINPNGSGQLKAA